jgi:hypothetical protein
MKKIPTFLLGTLVGVALTCSTVVGAANYLKATAKDVKLTVGNKVTSVSAVNVNNKLYIPVRDSGEAFGFHVADVTSSAVTFKEKNSSTTTSNSATSTSSKNQGDNYVTGLEKNYSVDGKINAEKVALGIASGELTINSADADSGNSLIHYAVLQDNFALYQVIKKNDLNVDSINKQQQTPLHFAIINKRAFFLGELKTLKADPNIKDSNGKLPIDYAEPNSSDYNSLKVYMW